MVNWAEKISKTSSASSFLFNSNEYVRYAEIVAPLEAKRDEHLSSGDDNLPCNQPSLRKRQTSIFATGEQLISEEMKKVEFVVREKLNALQDSIRNNRPLDSIDGLGYQPNKSPQKVRRKNINIGTKAWNL